MTTVRRWDEQEWLVDKVVELLGIEFDQNRVGYTLAACGVQAAGDFAAIRARVRRFGDIAREFARAGARRERQGMAFEAAGHRVSARESWFIAALHYASAQWPIFETNAESLALDVRKAHAYARYAALADHRVERVEIPFRGAVLPGWLHLPPGASAATPAPVVLGISGMDTTKEIRHALYGDRFLERGIAGLAIDGPGQGEALVTHGLHVTHDAFPEAGAAAIAWLRERPELDAGRIGVFGASFGSYWATQIAAAAGDAVAACAVAFVLHEPRARSIFTTASPSFRRRFLYMTGLEDEAALDVWREGMDLRQVAGAVTCPYLAVAGEEDHLSPIPHTYELLEALGGPRTLLLYEGEDHGLHRTTSSSLGPSPLTFTADWMADRLAGRDAASEHVYVRLTGEARREPWGSGRVHRRSWLAELDALAAPDVPTTTPGGPA